MEQKNKIGIIAFIFAIIAISGTSAIGTNTDFYLNLMNGSVTLLPGNNVSITDDVLNKTITISATGGVGGIVSDDTKVNKTGDIMTGILTVPMISISDSSGNTKYGYNAGSENTGIRQTVIGHFTGYQNTGARQTSLGYTSGYQNIGFGQTALGYDTGNKNTGAYQTAIGYNAGHVNIGVYQTVVGSEAGSFNTGEYQTAIGRQSGYANTGNNTVFVGHEAGKYNIEHNIFILKQNNVNPVPLITGNFTSGEVNIPGGNLNISTGNVILSSTLSSVLKFDGVNNYVNAGNAASLNITDAITIEAWIYLKPGTTTGYIISKNSLAASDNQYALYWDSSNKCLVTFLNGAYRGTSGINSVFTGSWYHTVMTYNRVDVRYYVNGILSGTPSAYTDSLIPTNFTVNIGRRKPNNLFFNGAIDEVRIYNRALSAGEIGSMYNGTYVNRSGLVLEMNMNEEQGLTSFDSSGYDNHGSLMNGVGWNYSNLPLKYNNEIYLNKTGTIMRK